MLKRYRRAAGLTQEELAERAGYSVGHVSKLESSVRLPISATVELLADALALGPAERSALLRAARRAGGQPQALVRVRAKGLAPLVGRSVEEACIERHLTGDVEPPLLLFAGEPGIGKSRLLQAAAERGVSEGWFVLEGACRRNGAQGPFGPLLEALASTIRPMNRSQLRAALDGCSWLVRLLPELAESGSAPMPAWSLPADQERRLMFSAVTRFLCNVAGPAGTLLLLDNAQWAGTDTLDLFGALVQAAPATPLRMIGAYRHNEVRPASDLAVLMADLARDRLVVRELIDALAPPAAAELLDVLLADAEHVDIPTRVEVLRKAAGAPFILVSYAQWLRLQANPEGIIPADLAIPWDVTQIVEQRVAALPKAARAIVRIAAVSDGDDAPDTLISVAGRLGYAELEAISAIDTACEAGLLIQRDDGRYAFTYDLFQQVVERSMGAAQHAYLHREIAEALEGQGARGSPSWEALADHHVRAGEPEQALIYLEQAGAHAKALHAYADAEYYYRTLVEYLDGHGRMLKAAQAREQLGIMLGYRGRYDEALAELERALEAYRSGGWRDAEVRVATLVGQELYAQGAIERGIARLEQEAHTVVGVADRSLAALYLSLAQLYGASGEYERALDAGERAAKLARASNDRRLLALAELERGTALGILGRVDEGLRVLEDAAIPITKATGDLWTQALALDRAAQSHILRGEFSEASRDIERGMLLAWQLDDQSVSAKMMLNRGILRFHRGAWRQAQVDLRWASATLHLHGLTPRAALAMAWLGQLSLAKGRWKRAEYELTRSLVLAEMGGDRQSAIQAQCARAEQDLLEGKPEQARLRLEPLLADAGNRRAELTGVLALLGWAWLELGDGRQGESLAAASVLRASATGLRCTLTDALRIQALVAARMGRWEEALECVEQARSLARMLSYPYAEAKALAVGGQLFLQRHEVGRGVAQLAAARSLLNLLGDRLYVAALPGPVEY
jgi:predicted ATPase